MARMQNALTKQLTDEHERVDLKLRESEETVRKIRQQREETGVQLYGVQHQLARMQTTFERTHDNYNIVQRYRTEAERQHEILQRQYEGKKEEADEQLKRVLKAQEELNQLNRTLKQVEEYNEVMKSEIAVTRRTTYRAEENVGNLEKSKKKQDLLIDSMNEEIKRLNEQKTLYQAQLISQKEETAAARNTLKEAAIEIERIVMSKKTLLEDWQKSLFGMQQRDKALQAIKELIKQRNDEILQIESEISGVRNETKKEQETSEDLHDKLNKRKKEIEFLDERMKELKAEKKKLDEQEIMLKNSLAKTELESQRMDQEHTNVQSKNDILDKSIMQLHTKTKSIRDDILSHASQQKTIEKSSANLLKQTKQAYENISNKEVDIENYANEISRVRLDNLNTQTQNEVLQKKLDDLIGELKEKERDVLDVERNIKARLLLIQQKTLQVDRLNRECANLQDRGGDGDEFVGPQEHARNNIKKQIKEVDEETTEVQKDWITNQIQLIKKQEDKTKVDRQNDDLRTQKSILDQKKIRINSDVEGHNKKIRELEVAKKNQVFEMNKLNDLIFQNNEKQEKLTNDNFNIEMEFKQKLKEMENESIKLENQITQLKEQKSDIIIEVIEAEKQILLWERKYQLEKEMQDALDPEIGQKEIVAMRKEIHRMQLQYDLFKKEQEKLIKDMERHVFKRETIQLKYLPKVEKKNAQDRSSQGKLSRQIANLKQNLKHTTEQTMQLDQTIEERKREINNVSNDINNEKDQNDQVGQGLREKKLQMLNQQLERSKLSFQHQKFRTMGDRYAEIATSKSSNTSLLIVFLFSFRPLPTPDARRPGRCHPSA